MPVPTLTLEQLHLVTAVWDTLQAIPRGHRKDPQTAAVQVAKQHGVSYETVAEAYDLYLSDLHAVCQTPRPQTTEALLAEMLAHDITAYHPETGVWYWEQRGRDIIINASRRAMEKLEAEAGGDPT